jgi:hypothetical protein
MKERNLWFILALILPFCIYGQLDKQTLNINALKVDVVSDGNLEEIKDAALDKYLNYTTQIWLSARDVNDSLCVAAQLYRQSGRDFQPGPISNDPNAGNTYNRVWKINKTMIDSFTGGLYGGIVPAPIADWPAHGDTTQGESFYIAPFVDVNGNGYYNPLTDGDYPCILGDQAIFYVFNDDTTHTQSSATSLGIEVLAMAYGYSDNSFLDSIVFLEYTLRSKKKELKDFRVAAMADFDIGNSLDDICGTFVDQNTIIGYNSDADDEGALGFGNNPPATGLTVLSGIQANWFDALDNDKDGCVDGVRDANGVCQPIDSANNVIESWRLSSSMHYNNTASVSGNPSDAQDYVNYMASLWKDGSNLVIENPSGFMDPANGDGFISSGAGTPTLFAYPGNTFDTTGAFLPTSPTNWFESPDNRNDKRMLAGLGHRDTLSIGNVLRFKLALFMARDTNSLNSFDAAYAMAQKINGFEDSVISCSGSRLITVVENELESPFQIYPNPANRLLRIQAPQYAHQEALLFHTNGRLVKTVNLDAAGNQVIEVVDLPSGLYIIKIGRQLQRFVISR